MRERAWIKATWALGLLLACAAVDAKRSLVETPEQYRRALKSAGPGDVIVLANGTWRDFELVFRAEGQPGAPVTLEAEEFGKVILSGRSSLELTGNHLHVRGLVFKDGYSPRGEVISFRRSKTQIANHSRVSETVIDGFSLPDRHESDHWVALFGRNNRFDHNHLVGKTNAGVTLAVRLEDENSRDNGHRIDHNYFGPRPVLGSNGGETLRIGTSAESMFDSRTLVEHNVFDRCNGEVEIISNKSGGNTFRGNLFLASQGTLTLRHGDGNLVEDNVFLGGGIAHTGGIRVINRRQVVRNNYMEGLHGSGFAAALAVMNGVPNSPVNRYVQVTDALIEHNTVVDSRQIGLAVGSDAERSATPADSRISNNLLFGIDGQPLLVVEDDISGIAFEDNLSGEHETVTLPSGVTPRRLDMVRAENGLLYPSDPSIQLGVSRELRPIALRQTGVDWYPKPPAETGSASSQQTIEVEPGHDSLSAAVAAAPAGATLALKAGLYSVSRVISLDRPLSIAGPTRAESTGESGDAGVARITFSRSSMFDLHTGARLRLVDLDISGADAPDAVGNAFIRTAAQPPAAAVQIEMLRLKVHGFTVNAGFNVIAASKNSLAERILVRDSQFADISGSVIAADSESDDFGRYNVDEVEIQASSFDRIGGAAIALYRGGSDESTFGPRFVLQDSSLSEVGLGKRNKSGAALHLHGVQQTLIQRNRFIRSAPLRLVHTVGEPRTEVSHNLFEATEPPTVIELNRPGAERAVLRPNQFVVAP